MILKLSGCVLVFLSSVLIGISFKVYTKRRLASLENMLHCMQCFETEIRFSLCDIISATEKMLKVAEKDNQIIFSAFLKKASEAEGRTLSDIWKSTVEKNSREICYDKEDIKVLVRFGDVLGSGDVETQLKNISLLCLSIEENIDSLKNKSGKNDDVFSKLGIYIGALLVVFLI